MLASEKVGKFRGHLLGDIDVNSVGFGQIRPEVGQLCAISTELDICIGIGPMFGQIRPNWSQCGQTWRELGPERLGFDSNFPRVWQHIARFWPTLDDVGRILHMMSANVWPDRQKHGPISGRFRQFVGQIRPILGYSARMYPSRVPISTELGPCTANFRPNSTRFGECRPKLA